MTEHRLTAVLVGILFILATAMGVTNAVLLGPIVGAENYLAAFSDNASTVNLSMMLNIVMASAVIAIAVAIFPLLKGWSETLAIGYLSIRIFEGVILAVAGIFWLALVALGAEFVEAGAPEMSHFQTLGDSLMLLNLTTFTMGAEIVFGASAILLNYLLIRTKLVPLFISVWGLLGGALLLIKGSMSLLGLPVDVIEVAFTAPIALNEMVLALWLIFKGFGKSAIKI